MAEKLEFDLRVGVNELQKAISDATTGSKKLGDTISTAIGTFAGQAAIKGFNLLGDAIGNVGGFLRDSVKASAEQDDALNRLAQSLRSTGEFSRQAVEDFSDFASELQRTSVFGDEVVIGQIAIAKAFGATNDQAKQLVQAAANLAATFGGSLEENIFKLGKTLNGVVNRDLKSVIPELQGLSREAILTGAAIDLVNKKFSGAAAAELNTYTGSTISLSNAFSDLQEEIGAFITRSDDVGSFLGITKQLIIELTQSLVDYRTEQQRANGTLVETDGTLNRLSEQYAKTRDELEKYQSVISADESKTLLQSLFSFDNAPLAREKVQQLTAELAKLDQQITQASEQLKATQAQTAVTPRQAPQTQQEINQLDQLEAQKTALIQQAELERNNFRQELANVNIQNQLDREQAEIQRIFEFETAKRDIETQFALEKAQTLNNEQLIAAETARIQKEAELKAIQDGNKKILAEEQLKNKRAQDSIFFFRKFEDQTNKERVQNLQSTLSTIATLSDSGNKTLAAIGKASAISTATIDGFVAVNKALASAPPPVNYALAAAVGAATAANVAKIAGVKFQDGGIVGASRGPDNQLAAIRTGEMVLNADQQKTLFDMINSGSIGGGEIVVQIDGREIAKAVRTQIQSGFRLA